MSNPLLDFVISLVRDPDAAARYARNPAQAIADANLDDVTSADVEGLIPVVAESLSGGHPLSGAEGVDVNVWAGAAATTAFDAFAPLPAAAEVAAMPPSLFEPVMSPKLESTARALAGGDVPRRDPVSFETAAEDVEVGDLEIDATSVVDDLLDNDPGAEFDDGGLVG